MEDVLDRGALLVDAQVRIGARARARVRLELPCLLVDAPGQLGDAWLGVTGGDIGGFRGGSLEHPRQWLGAQ
eukprot:scaffold66490_cov41-Phaeocystis_antarctica.AAC.4